jgi:hypothetical protein
MVLDPRGGIAYFVRKHQIVFSWVARWIDMSVRNPTLTIPMKARMAFTVYCGLPPVLIEAMDKSPVQVLLAGGAVRDIVDGKNPRDFDLFVKNASEAIGIMECIHAFCESSYRESAWSQTSDCTLTAWVGNGSKEVIQASYGWCWNEPGDLLDQFDFTVAQAAIWLEGADAVKGVVGENFERDLKNKRLELVHGIGSTTMERIIRYYSKGFIPETIASLSQVSEADEYFHERMKDVSDELRKMKAEVNRAHSKLDSEELFIQRVNAKIKQAELEGSWEG